MAPFSFRARIDVALTHYFDDFIEGDFLNKSQRMNCGARPRLPTSRSSVATVRSASIRRWHSIASASRVNSSTTCRSSRIFPPALWSN